VMARDSRGFRAFCLLASDGEGLEKGQGSLFGGDDADADGNLV